MIYLDNAATTPICDAAKKAIIDNLNYFGNPSSSHTIGHQAKMMLENARERIARCINANPEEIFFTSGGSEANNWALVGRTRLTSWIEHHSVMTNYGFSVEENGIADPEYVREVIKSYCRKGSYYMPEVISCMMVNNEIGTIQPIKEIAKIAHEYDLFMHTDAVQAVGHIPIDVKDIGCDMLSASGHKFGAPKGVGFLYLKNGTEINTLIHGGKQEQGIRGGTENVLGIVAMAVALEDSLTHMEERNNHVKWLRDCLLSSILSIDDVYLNGSSDNRLVSNINVRINGVSGQDVVAMANEYGICISTGSACNEGIATPSRVLKEIGLTDEEALSSIRITLGHENTFEEINYVCEILPKIINVLRTI
jgi:cysteine desulfurase